jgi:hypothetical protein
MPSIMHAARRSCIRYASAVVGRFGACLLLLFCACSNDTFVGGEDASAADGTSDGEGIDVGQPGDAVAIEASPGGFCSLHGEAFFCDDWDDAQETSAWNKWSFPTPSQPNGAIDFGAGVSGRGALIKSGAVSNAYLTEQTQNDALHGLVFEMKIENLTASTTYVRLQAETKTFTIASDGLAQNLVVTGDSGGTQTLGPASTTWHHYEVAFQNQNATVTEDNGAHATTVGFSPQAPTSSTLAVGLVSGALGGTVDFDDLLLR